MLDKLPGTWAPVLRPFAPHAPRAGTGVEPWAQNRDAKIGQEGMPEVEGVCSLVLKQEGAELQQPIDGPLIEVLVRHIHSDGLLDSAGHDIYERLKIKRLGDNARERGSPAPRAFTELGLSEISRVASEQDHRGSSIAPLALAVLGAAVIWGTDQCPSPWRPGARLTLVTTHLPPSSAARRAISHTARFTLPHRIHAPLHQLQRPPRLLH
jgi:hypothetical protein